MQGNWKPINIKVRIVEFIIPWPFLVLAQKWVKLISFGDGEELMEERLATTRLTSASASS